MAVVDLAPSQPSSIQSSGIVLGVALSVVPAVAGMDPFAGNPFPLGDPLAVDTP